jgi:hypothetical protein
VSLIPRRKPKVLYVVQLAVPPGWPELLQALLDLLSEVEDADEALIPGGVREAATKARALAEEWSVARS